MTFRRSFSASLLLFIFAASAAGAAESPFISNARQLTYEGMRSGEGYFHPDGNLLVFQSERDPANPFYQIHLLDLLSGETARVSPGIGKTTCAFFQPGASRLLFASTHLDPEAKAKQEAELEFRAAGRTRRYSWDYDPETDIFTANQDGTQLQRLTDAKGYDAEGAFSPDGKQIVFTSLRDAYSRDLSPEEKSRLEKDPAWFGDIFVMNADGSGQRRLTDTPGYDGGPFFSPDGKRIVWRRFDASGMNADVFTMKTDGSDVQRVTDFKSMSWAPFFHPGGGCIIFTSNKLGFENFELFIVDAAGKKEPVRVTFTDGFDGLPVFSPDGRRLCWTTTRGADGKSQLWLADWDDGAARRALAESPARPSVPSVASPADSRSESASPETRKDTFAALTSPISTGDLKAEVTWLSSPARGGRMTGSPGAQSAADELAAYLAEAGAQPIGDSFFQPFEFNAGERIQPEGNTLAIVGAGTSGDADLKVDRDFRPLSFTENAAAEGSVVFAGYGLSVPEGGGDRYNSYDGLDVTDKVVLILRYVPEGVTQERRAQLNRYAGLRYKAMMARERGAKAVLFVTGPNSPSAGELLPLSSDNVMSGSGIVAASITGAVAEALLAPTDKTLAALQTGLDTENPHAEASVEIPQVKVKIAAAVEHVKKSDRNVIGVLPPAGIDEYILLGAHYDHLGAGAGGSSMARSGEEGQIHPGADDNASGTALIMELAAALARKRAENPGAFQRGVVFAFWSGEELGLIGSAAFTQDPPVPLEKIAAYLNFDMVGRLRENKLTVQGVGSSHLWPKLLEKKNVAAGFNLALQDDPYLPTDTTSFYPKRIPVLNFFTGAHEDYHRPTDTAEKLDYAGLDRIARFTESIVLELVKAGDRPDFAHVQRSDSAGGSRDSLRAYLGTIPDYTIEVKGVRLSGVRGGSPAEKGGLKGDDVILEFAGQKITNIYDYTYALDAVKIGQPVEVVVDRSGRKVKLTVTPEARK